MPTALPPRGRALDSHTKALIAARAALDKQAEDIVILDLRTLSTVTDFFILCTAGSAPQVNAISDSLDSVLSKHGCPVWHVEGVPVSGRAAPLGAAAQWVLMDCGDVVVHLFDQRARAFYRLEDLWADAPRVSLPAG